MGVPELQGEVVVTWPVFDVDGPMTGRRLTDAGLSIRLSPRTGARTPLQMREVVGDAVAVIASTDPFDADLFRDCRSLAVIARTGVGVDSIDVAAATEAGVAIATAPGTNEETVADHALAQMLSLLRRLPEHDRSMREGRWDRGGAITPDDLCGSTVGVIGAGVIGRAVIRRVLAFGSRVLVADPALAQPVPGTELVPLDRLLAEADVVSIHVPLSDRTRGLIGVDELARMKPSAVLVNSSRGHIVDEDALVAALRAGNIRAAAVDVFAEEPPDGSELIDLPNVLLSPHIGGLSHRAISAMTEMATTTVLAVLRGELPPVVINRDALR